MERSDARLLQELADRERIRELLHRYCYAVDRGTVDSVMNLFDDPCDLELVPGRRYEGLKRVQEWYDEYIKNRMEVLRHLIHNQVIELRGDEAVSHTYFDAVGDLNGESIVVAGYYDDRLRRTGAGWKFQQKIIRLDFLVPLHEGWSGKRIKRSLVRDVP